MKKLQFIEDGAYPILDEQAVRDVARALENRYHSYLCGHGARLETLPERVRTAFAMAQAHQTKDAGSSNGFESFDVICGFTPSQVQLRVTLRHDNGSWGYPVDTVVLRQDDEVFDVKNIEVIQQRLKTLFDFQDAYWLEYFSSGRETFVTLDWSAHSFVDRTVYVRGFERAWSLEAAADRLFLEFGSGSHDIEPVGSET
jgi:hypothetical protein